MKGFPAGLWFYKCFKIYTCYASGFCFTISSIAKEIDSNGIFRRPGNVVGRSKGEERIVEIIDRDHESESSYTGPHQTYTWYSTA